MNHAHSSTRFALPPSRSAASLVLVAGELITALVIIAGGGWLTALASLH